MPVGERRAQDVLMGFRPPISSNTPPHFGHWMMCDARRINSFGWIEPRLMLMGSFADSQT
jgi:hypothetical protein